MSGCQPLPADETVPRAHQSQYDTQALKQRADQWRDEAAVVHSEEMRMFCLDEAGRYERRLQQSVSMPVFRGWETFEA